MYICIQAKRIMKTQGNIHDLKVGDKIEFLNRANYLISHEVTRTTDKSCFLGCSRNSWSTINSHFNEFDVKIIK